VGRSGPIELPLDQIKSLGGVFIMAEEVVTLYQYDHKTTLSSYTERLAEQAE